MKINEQEGNLFELDKKYALAHCTSLDCVQHDNVSIELYKIFKNMRTSMLQSIKDSKLQSPVVICCFDGKERIVFNLFTKKEYWWNPTYKALTECIKQMVRYCIEYNINYLAMPRLDCGEDELKWEKVKKIIEREFEGLDIEIEIRY